MATLDTLNRDLEELGDISETLETRDRTYIEGFLNNLDDVRLQVIMALLNKLTEEEIELIEFFGERGESALFAFMRNIAPVDGAEQIDRAVKAEFLKVDKGEGEGVYSLTTKGEKVFQMIKESKE